MISHKHKFIFVGIPKTGTSSINSLLGEGAHKTQHHMDLMESKYEIEKTLLPYDFIAGRPIALDSESRTRIAQEMFDSYFKFGFVRNPWDRAVSLYRRREGIQLSGLVNFEEFVNWIRYSSDTCVHPSRHLNQLDWLTDDNGKVVADFIGQLENIDKDWESVSARLGVGNMPIPCLNKREERVHYTEYYTTRTREIINRKFAVDIDYFGYTFG